MVGPQKNLPFYADLISLRRLRICIKFGYRSFCARKLGFFSTRAAISSRFWALWSLVNLSNVSGGKRTSPKRSCRRARCHCSLNAVAGFGTRLWSLRLPESKKLLPSVKLPPNI
eukprot:Blabericola_migrator_1__2976@NODE_185_length_11802_cov_66_327567_g160_i0_p13_GENE_NODE_185_length_11802_cov_66_327567_g160_i0NODE_185_length_11802_cov_66_327567_g160_i0_p13_ORF_typecomplete_len114_score0_58NTP_transferase/PF00483_23/0_11_NODE_185_length_11802_cov_66_327567_g160_i07791120